MKLQRKRRQSRKTEWHCVTAWGKQQKSLKNITKGKEVAIEGKLHIVAMMIKTEETIYNRSCS
jgi:single-stranded DNA-binding protein